MGREKRIAESRAKEETEKKAPTAGTRPAPSVPMRAESAAVGAPVQYASGTSLVRAVLQIVALYVIPIGLVLLIGRLIFGL